MTIHNHHKISFCIIALLLSVLTVSAQRPDYKRADSIRVMRLFQRAKVVKKSMPTYMVFFGRQLKGVPYVAKTLEKNRTERLVVNLRQLDCTTYVETVLALSRSMVQGKPTFTNFCRNLQWIRYKDGEVAYTNRQHYFTYWIKQNVKKGIVKEVQGPNPPYSAIQTVRANYMTTHLYQYPMLKGRPSWVKQIKAMEQDISGSRKKYIPKRAIRNSNLLKRTIHNGDIIAIVTIKKGLEISHLGIAVWHRDGLHMLNASSLYHKIVEDRNTLRKYMFNQKTGVGIRNLTF